MKNKRVPLYFVAVLLVMSCLAFPINVSAIPPTTEDPTDPVDPQTPSTPPEIDPDENTIVTGQKPAGSGTVIDYVKSGNREFYTILTEDEGVYYLVIDKDKDTENVYYLKEINNADLDKSGNNPPVINPETPSKPTDPQTPTTPPTNQPSNPSVQDNPVFENQTLWLVGAVVLVVGAVGYYVKLVKPKKDKKRILKKEAQEHEQEYDSFDSFNQDDSYYQE